MARKPTTTKKVTKDTQKGNDQSQIESSNQSMDELVALSQEILPEQYATIDSSKPVEAVEEESTETSTVGAPEAKVAVIESEEPTTDTESVLIKSEGMVWNSRGTFTTLCSKILLAAQAGLELDLTSQVRTEYPPFFLRMKGAEPQIKKYEELVEANQEPVAVEGKVVKVSLLSRYDFVKKIILLGKQGGIINKGTVASRHPRFSVNVILPETK